MTFERESTRKHGPPVLSPPPHDAVLSTTHETGFAVHNTAIKGSLQNYTTNACIQCCKKATITATTPRAALFSTTDRLFDEELDTRFLEEGSGTDLDFDILGKPTNSFHLLSNSLLRCLSDCFASLQDPSWFLDRNCSHPMALPDVIQQLHGLNGTHNLSESASRADSILMIPRIIFWTYGVAMLCVAIFGIFGNIMTFIIMTRSIMRSCINTYLAGLAVFDGFLLFLASFIYPVMPHCFVAKPAMCFLLTYPLLATYPLSILAQTGSVWTCATISFDRFLAICYPLKARALCTVRRAQYTLVGITVFSFVYTLPIWFEVSVDANGSLEETAFRKSEKYFIVYKIYLYLFIMILFPLCIMIVTNIFVLRAMAKASTDRMKMSGRYEKERRVTFMVILVIISFVLLNFLAFVCHFLEGMGSKWTSSHTDAYQGMVTIGNLLVSINSATNFLIYCVFGRKFRKMIVKMFCPCFISPRDGSPRFPRGIYGSQRTTDGPAAGIISMRRIPSGPRRGIPPKHLISSKSIDVPTFDSEEPYVKNNSMKNRAPTGGSLDLKFDFSALNNTQKVRLLDQRLDDGEQL